MKKTIRYILVCFVALMAATACSTAKEDNEILESTVTPVNAELTEMAAETPALESASVSYADADYKIDVRFADSNIAVADLSESLVQYALAMYLKSHTGQRLDDIANALTRLDGKMTVTVTDVDNASRSYEIPVARVKQLVRLRPMELNFTEVRANVLEIMGKRCAALREATGADDVQFAFSGGFAQYSFTFGSARDYSRYNRGSLTGHYVNLLKPEYESFGAMRPFVVQLLTSLQIEGYRFAYDTAAGGNSLKAVVPWRLLN